jgi:hypothetical protein
VPIHLAHGPCQPAVTPLGNDAALDAKGGADVAEGLETLSSHRTIVDNPASPVIIHKRHQATDLGETVVLDTQIRMRSLRPDGGGQGSYHCDAEPFAVPGHDSNHLNLRNLYDSILDITRSVSHRSTRE